MAIEIEKKYRLSRTRMDEVAAKLKKMGAVFSSEVFEENYLHRGGLLDERSAVLRLRKIGGVTLLTYKEKFRNDDDIKHKIEFETVVADVDAMESIIEKLGYRLSVIYEKHRKTWHFRDVEVVLDELPFGLYMEIEGTIEHIAKAEKVLEIRDLEPEARGYPRLTLKFGKMIGDVAEARFKRRAAA
ncbi:MAG: class IV adenylate cyclase [Blastocatellia bacterium]|nr:class IV adenylate cyclase [Blastocatellia bacterium]MDQ3220561.1 class IV adenylate cyclase [Acidobacteriota bacterium]